MKRLTGCNVVLTLGLLAAGLAGSAGADITIKDNPVASPWSFGQSATNTYTVSPDARVLIVTVGQKTSATAGSANYGGQPLTIARHQASGLTVYRASTIYYLWNPPAGANSLVVNAGTGANSCYANALTLAGVDTNVSPVAAGADNTTNLSPFVSVTPASAVLPGSFAVTMQGVNTTNGNAFTWYATAGGNPSGLSNSLWQVYDAAAQTAYGAGSISNLTAGTNTITGLSPGNTGNKNPLAVAIFAPPVPRISNGVATNISATSADVTGTLLTNGASTATVYLFWSTTDGTNNEAAWLTTGGVTNLGALADGATFTNTLSGLSYWKTYYWNYMASNSVGRGWGASSGSPSFLTRTFLSDASTWERKMKITFAGYTQPGALTNFPVLVVFSNGMSSGFSYGDFRSLPNQDLRFSMQDGTELSYEIDTWDPSGASYVWVRVPAIAGTNDFMWAYWGKSGLIAPTYTTNGSTWANNGFAAVWHMNGPTNAPTDSARQPVDHSVYKGATSNDALAKAVVGMGHSYNGYGMFVITNNADLSNGGVSNTVSFWYFKRSTGGAGTSAGFGTMLGKTNDGGPGIKHRVGESGVPDDALRYYSGPSYGWTPALANGAWYHIEFTKTPASYGGNVQIYVNGVPAGTWTNSASVLWIAPHCLVGSGGSNEKAIDGILDECRLSPLVRPANWIWAEWMNMASNRVFNLYGDVLSSASKGALFLIR